MFPIRAEWANISWRVVYKSMADHFVLALEAVAYLAARALSDAAVVGPILRVDVGMGTT